MEVVVFEGLKDPFGITFVFLMVLVVKGEISVPESFKIKQVRIVHHIAGVTFLRGHHHNGLVGQANVYFFKTLLR
jgi:hypothetical protein